MAHTSEPVGNVAGMGAKLPAAVPVDGKLFPAGRASEGVDRFPLHQIQRWLFHHLFRQASQQNRFRFRPGICSIGLPHCSQTNSDFGLARLCRRQNDFTVLMERPNWQAMLPYPAPLPAQGNNLLFLFVLHDGHLLKIWFSGVTGQKGYR